MKFPHRSPERQHGFAMRATAQVRTKPVAAASGCETVLLSCGIKAHQKTKHRAEPV